DPCYCGTSRTHAGAGTPGAFIDPNSVIITMSHSINGELVPVGGGDTIPLRSSPLTLGRRESCDVSLPFPNISSRHCELSFTREGFWSIRDLNSTNGVKVNGVRVQNRFLKPGDEINLAKRRYTIQYALPPAGLRELAAL